MKLKLIYLYKVKEALLLLQTCLYILHLHNYSAETPCTISLTKRYKYGVYLRVLQKSRVNHAESRYKCYFSSDCSSLPGSKCSR